MLNVNVDGVDVSLYALAAVGIALAVLLAVRAREKHRIRARLAAIRNDVEGV